MGKLSTMGVGTPRVTMHMEAETEDCICPRLNRCGGIDTFYVHCPEHGVNSKPQGKYHTHSVQVPGKIVGTHWRV
jgi:hypothetical protein